jgi:hypothetical protein
MRDDDDDDDDDDCALDSTSMRRNRLSKKSVSGYTRRVFNKVQLYRMTRVVTKTQ